MAHSISPPVRILAPLVLALTSACPGEPLPADDEVGESTQTDESTDASTTDSTDSTDTSTTGEPSFESCDFEWIVNAPILAGDATPSAYAPLVLEGEELFIAHQIGAQGQLDTRVTRAQQGTGALISSLDLDLSSSSDLPLALVRPSTGGYAITSTDAIEGAQVWRLDDQGALVWMASDPLATFARGLVELPEGRLASLATRRVGDQDDDARLTIYALDTGAVLETHDYGGEVAANGFSLDEAESLVVGEDGGLFVGLDVYLDWDTIAPVIHAFSPLDLELPLWTTPLIAAEGQLVHLRSFVRTPDGLLVAIHQRYDATGMFWITALDPATGEIAWTVGRDELELPTIEYSNARTIAASATHLFVAGAWRTEIDAVDVWQGYVLELDHAGNLICHATLDDYVPEANTFSTVTEFMASGVDASGDLLLAGYSIAAFNPLLEGTLALAKLRG